MGPSCLKLLSMCLWRYLKRSSLQNFTRLTQPLLPVWGISSKLRTRPSTPLFPSPILSLPPGLLSTVLSTTVPAIQNPLWAEPLRSPFLGPQAACPRMHRAVTWVDMLLMVPSLHWGLVQSLKVSSSPLPKPHILECAPSCDGLIWANDLWIWRQEFKGNTTATENVSLRQNTHLGC